MTPYGQPMKPSIQRATTYNPFTGAMLTQAGDLTPDEIPVSQGGNLGGIGSGISAANFGLGNGNNSQFTPNIDPTRFRPVDPGWPMPRRKHGGRVKASHKIQPYIVNEGDKEEMFQPEGGMPQIIEGPEQMFIPPADGKIIPHKKASRIAKDLGMLPPKHAKKGADVYLPANDNYDSHGRYQNTTRTLLPPTKTEPQGLKAFHEMQRGTVADRSGAQFNHSWGNSAGQGESRAPLLPPSPSDDPSDWVKPAAPTQKAGGIGMSFPWQRPAASSGLTPQSTERVAQPAPSTNAMGVDHKFLRDMVSKHYGEESKERSDDWLDKIDESEKSGQNPMDLWKMMKSYATEKATGDRRKSALTELASKGALPKVQLKTPMPDTVLADGTVVTTNGPDGQRIPVLSNNTGTSAPDYTQDPQGAKDWHKANLSPENYAMWANRMGDISDGSDFDIRVIKQKAIEDKENQKYAGIKSDSALRDAFRSIDRKRLIQDLEDEKNRDLRSPGKIWAEKDWNEGKKLAGEGIRGFKSAAKRAYLAATNPKNWMVGNYVYPE